MKKVLAKVIHGIVYITYIVLFWLLFPISNIFYGRKRIWLINERGYDARDNGYHFFKYVVSNHPEIKCFYAIDKKSSDYKNIEQFNNILQFGSLKHIFFFTCAKAKISSQMYGYAPNKYYVKYMENHHLQGKNIGLKHGIFKNIHPNYFKERSHLDLIICGAEPEYKFIKDNFGYKDDEVAYCGLARFDNLLNNKPKKQILVMPTFRIPLSGMTKEEFSKTDYFKKWSIFLKNLDERLDDWSNYQAIFYIHAVFQKYVSLFFGIYKNIVIAKFEEYDVQALLKESAILVTDYSSVFFDFAYMRKPTIFYQFDEQFFNANHYEKGYFDYKRDGFGNVFYDERLCVNEVCRLLDKNCKIDDVFNDKIDKFFTLPRDNNNCDRIFKEIKRII